MSSKHDPSLNRNSTPPPLVREAEPVASLGRLHPSSILFGILSQIRTMIFPAIIATFSAARGNTWGLALGSFLVFPAIVVAAVRYFSLRYRIQGGELVVTEGVFYRRVRTVPVHRIQNINLVQNPLHRLVKVAEARIETASGTEPEAVLRVLPLRDVDALRAAIFEGADRQPSDSTMDEPEDDTACLAESELLRIPTPWLCRAGLANNRGMVLVGLILGSLYQFELYERLSLDSFGAFFERQVPEFAMPIVAIVASIAVLVLIRMLSVAWYVQRFYDYSLTRRGDDLSISCGLFTKISASVPRRRIQFISIHQNFWMKLMGISSIRIETAGGTSDAQDASSSVASRWFIPVVTDDKIPFLLRELRDGIEWHEEELDWRPLSPDTEKRLTRVTLFGASLLAIVGYTSSQPWGFLIGVGAWPPLFVYAMRKSRGMRYARWDQGVAYRSGLFTRKLSMTFFDRVQTLKIGQSPFDRRWDMATLSVDTAAAGPADHRINVQFLSADFAKREYTAILERVSEN